MIRSEAVEEGQTFLRNSQEYTTVRRTQESGASSASPESKHGRHRVPTLHEANRTDLMKSRG